MVLTKVSSSYCGIKLESFCYSDTVLCLIPSIITVEQVHNVAQLTRSNEFMHNICLVPQIKKKEMKLQHCEKPSL